LVQMSRYFFHMQNGSTTLDAEGVDFPDLDSARREMICTCGEILRDVPAAIWNGDTLRMWVTDQPEGEGNTLFGLNISPRIG
jgi:Domain of unknown function (DUF6894)